MYEYVVVINALDGDPAVKTQLSLAIFAISYSWVTTSEALDVNHNEKDTIGKFITWRGNSSLNFTLLWCSKVAIPRWMPRLGNQSSSSFDHNPEVGW